MENLRVIRENRKVTQIRLSTGIDVSQETISAYESGKAMPSAETLVRIADFLNTSTDYLLGRIDKDIPLNQIVSDDMDEKLKSLMNNYLLLEDKKKEELLWYSNVLRDR